MKKGWQGCITLGLWLLLFLPTTSDVSAADAIRLTCPTPTGMSVTAKTSSSVSFAWNTMSGASGYQVYYVRLADSSTSSVMTTGSPAITVSGLAPGTYRFYFATVCDSGTSDYVVLDDIVIN